MHLCVTVFMSAGYLAAYLLDRLWYMCFFFGFYNICAESRVQDSYAGCKAVVYVPIKQMLVF